MPRPLFEDDWPQTVDPRLLSREDRERFEGMVLRIVTSGRRIEDGISGLFDDEELWWMKNKVFECGVMADSN